MVKNFKKLDIILILGVILFFFSPFLLFSKVPTPSDTIIGLYHPFRDFYAKEFPNGIPFKNFLITDPVRQTYAWKELAIDVYKKGEIPVWNPYEMAGKPLAANFQTGVFYPLNILLFIKPFYLSWSVFIFSQSILGGIFMYIYLKNHKLDPSAVSVGTIAFVLSGFSVSWLEWGNILHTAIWLPLVLFSIDRLFDAKFNKNKILFALLLLFSLVSAFLAGHLQIFFYLFLISCAYFLINLFQIKNKLKFLVYYGLVLIGFVITTFFQWFSTIKFILHSARSIDQNYLDIEGWFVPFEHLIQFIAPDFFGNPVTLNYWGTWNYGELTGYVGLTVLILAFVSLLKMNRKVAFFSSVLVISLIMSLPTPLAKLPYELNVPLISSSQPTRLIFIITFCLSVLSAFGLSSLLEIKNKKKFLLLPIGILGLIIITLWILILTKSQIFPDIESIDTSRRNLILPTIIFIISSIYISIIPLIRNTRFKKIVVFLILTVVVLDLYRFAEKFTPFTKSSYLFPTTGVINYLKEKEGLFRVGVLDRRIIPPNFFTHYKIQTIEGYDPLYLKSYAEFISMMERDKPDISTPYGFNRIITPHNYNSPLFDFLNVKYVLSYDDIESDKMIKVYEEGVTKIYENMSFLKRVYFVENVVRGGNVPANLFKYDLSKTAIITDSIPTLKLSLGEVTVVNYSENSVKLKTRNNGDGFIVMSDVFYPDWDVYIDGVKSKIYKTNHSFRGIFVPKGEHDILMKASIL